MWNMRSKMASKMTWKLMEASWEPTSTQWSTPPWTARRSCCRSRASQHSQTTSSSRITSSHEYWTLISTSRMTIHSRPSSKSSSARSRLRSNHRSWKSHQLFSHRRRWWSPSKATTARLSPTQRRQRRKQRQIRPISSTICWSLAPRQGTTRRPICLRASWPRTTPCFHSTLSWTMCKTRAPYRRRRKSLFSGTKSCSRAPMVTIAYIASRQTLGKRNWWGVISSPTTTTGVSHSAGFCKVRPPS